MFARKQSTPSMSHKSNSTSLERLTSSRGRITLAPERPQPNLEGTHHLYSSHRRSVSSLSLSAKRPSEDGSVTLYGKQERKQGSAWTNRGKTLDKQDMTSKRVPKQSNNDLSHPTMKQIHLKNTVTKQEVQISKKPNTNQKVEFTKVQMKQESPQLKIGPKQGDVGIENLLFKLKEIKGSINDVQNSAQIRKSHYLGKEISQTPKENPAKGLLRQRPQDFDLKTRNQTLKLKEAKVQSQEPPDKKDRLSKRINTPQHIQNGVVKTVPVNKKPEPSHNSASRIPSNQKAAKSHIHLIEDLIKPTNEGESQHTFPYRYRNHQSSRSLGNSNDMEKPDKTKLMRSERSSNKLPLAQSVRSKLKNMVSRLELEITGINQGSLSKSLTRQPEQTDKTNVQFVKMRGRSGNLVRNGYSGLDSLEDLSKIDTLQTLTPSPLVGLNSEHSLPPVQLNEYPTKLPQTRTPIFAKRSHKHSNSMHSDKNPSLLLLTDPTFLRSRLTDKIAVQIQSMKQQDGWQDQGGDSEQRNKKSPVSISSGVQSQARKLIETLGLQQEVLKVFGKKTLPTPLYYIGALHREYSMIGKVPNTDFNLEKEYRLASLSPKLPGSADSQPNGSFLSHFTNNLQGLLVVLGAMLTSSRQESEVRGQDQTQQRSKTPQMVSKPKDLVGCKSAEKEKSGLMVTQENAKKGHKKSASVANEWMQLKVLATMDALSASMKPIIKSHTNIVKAPSSKRVIGEETLNVILDKESFISECETSRPSYCSQMEDFVENLKKQTHLKLFSVENPSQPAVPPALPKKQIRQATPPTNPPKSRWENCFSASSILRTSQYVKQVGSKQLPVLDLEKVSLENGIPLTRTVLLSSRFYWAGKHYRNLVPVLTSQSNASKNLREPGELLNFLKYLLGQAEDVRNLLDTYFGWDILAKNSEGTNLENLFAQRIGILVARYT